MTIERISDTLRAFIKAEFNVPESDAEFTDDVHLFAFGYIDSFGAVVLTRFVEETFSIKVQQSDLIVHPMNTIREIATFVVRRQAGEI